MQAEQRWRFAAKNTDNLPWTWRVVDEGRAETRKQVTVHSGDSSFFVTASIASALALVLARSRARRRDRTGRRATRAR